jgi:hypothetical protein
MVGATAVVATIMAGAEAEATTMVGGTIVIGNLICRSEEAAPVGGLFRFGHILRQASLVLARFSPWQWPDLNVQNGTDRTLPAYYSQFLQTLRLGPVSKKRLCHASPPTRFPDV